MSLGIVVILLLAVAGCGGSKSPSVPTVATTTTTSGSPAAGTTTASRGPTGTSPTGSAAPSTAAQRDDDLLKYSLCMRANGVPNFPDPASGGGGFTFQKGSVDFTSPAFNTAQQKCDKVLPGGGPPGPGTSTHPTSQWLGKMVKAAQCMRAHGIAGFPDPTTTVPPMPAGGGVISDIEGAIFVFPSSFDMQSPQFVRAAGVCGFPLHNH